MYFTISLVFSFASSVSSVHDVVFVQLRRVARAARARGHGLGDFQQAAIEVRRFLTWLGRKHNCCKFFLRHLKKTSYHDTRHGKTIWKIPLPNFLGPTLSFFVTYHDVFGLLAAIFNFQTFISLSGVLNSLALLRMPNPSLPCAIFWRHLLRPRKSRVFRYHRDPDKPILLSSVYKVFVHI